MDVTSDNFHHAESLVDEILESSSFVAFDTELSGLGTGNRDQEWVCHDSFEDRYQKLVNTTREFGLFQMGLSFFCYNSSTKMYETSTFSFNLMKKCPGKQPFTSCYNSMHFLANTGFDFNKLFQSGITYVNVNEMHRLRNKIPMWIKDRRGQFLDKQPVSRTKVPDEVLEYIKKTSKVFRRHILDSPSVLNILGVNTIDDLSQISVDKLKVPKHFFTKDLHSEVFKFNGTKEEVRSVCDSIRAAYNNVDVHYTHKDWETFLNVAVFPNKAARDEYIIYDVINHFNEQIGFSKIMVKILASGIPIVGHNPMFDVTHMMEKFITPLPSNLSQFQQLYKANIKELYDTKVVSIASLTASPLKHYSLKEVFMYCQSGLAHPPQLVTMSGGHNSYVPQSEDRSHDAGYDAFMTGYAFASLLNHASGGHFDWQRRIPFFNYSNQVYVARLFGSEKFYLAEKVPLKRTVLLCASQEPVEQDVLRSYFMNKKVDIRYYYNDRTKWYIAVQKGERDFRKKDVVTLKQRMGSDGLTLNYWLESKAPRKIDDNFVFASVSSLMKMATEHVKPAEGSNMDYEVRREEDQSWMKMMLVLAFVACLIGIQLQATYGVTLQDLLS